ncbi:hypothetical protein [Devosia sp. CAU 1758]
MPDPLERRPENRDITSEQVPSMPRHLPTEDTDNPHSTPLRREQESETPNDETPGKRDDDVAP